MAYRYQKATPDHPSPGKLIPRYLRLAPILVSALGLTMVSAVAWPFVSYQIGQIINDNNNQAGLLNPVYYESFANDQPQANAPTYIGEIDYTTASNWFTFSPSDALPITRDFQDKEVKEYKLAIPSLGISNARVKANSDDLSSSLIQYHQTAFPGENGSPVIFGHSSLPQFFDPKNYLTIFSTLPTIKIGSDVSVNYDDVVYTYRVRKIYEVKPSEVWVLRQDYSAKTLKLITCVPPGTKLKRLVVEADLIKI